MMRVIVAGTRTFKDYELLRSKLDEFLKDIEDIEIVSGSARGADALGERYAKEKGYKITRFPADWNRFGKSAGYIRNKEMAKYSTNCIVFWDGKSKGTKHMIDLAKKHELKLKVILFTEDD